MLKSFMRDTRILGGCGSDVALLIDFLGGMEYFVQLVMVVLWAYL